MENNETKNINLDEHIKNHENIIREKINNKSLSFSDNFDHLSPGTRIEMLLFFLEGEMEWMIEKSDLIPDDNKKELINKMKHLFKKFE